RRGRRCSVCLTVALHLEPSAESMAKLCLIQIDLLIEPLDKDKNVVFDPCCRRRNVCFAAALQFCPAYECVSIICLIETDRFVCVFGGAKSDLLDRARAMPHVSQEM